jgi:hypothetical protein
MANDEPKLLDTFDTITRDLLRKKLFEFEMSNKALNEKIMSATLADDAGIPCDISASDMKDFESYFIITLFRNWYIAAAAKAQNNWNNPTLHHSEECTIEEKQGALYRLIDKGGDAYLPDNEVRELLKRLPLDGKAMGRENGLQWAGWRLDLGLLKQYAKNWCAAYAGQ